MKLETLIQKLSDVYPWTVHAVERVLGTKLSNDRPYMDNSFFSTKRLAYEEGLLVNEVEVRIIESTGKTVRLILSLADDAACFTRKRIEQTYPDIFLTDVPRGRSMEDKAYFTTKRPWGELSFGFKEKRRDCLSSIVFIPEWDD
jgi:hypothetical protein